MTGSRCVKVPMFVYLSCNLLRISISHTFDLIMSHKSYDANVSSKFVYSFHSISWQLVSITNLSELV